MFSVEVTALLKAVLDEVCEDVSVYDTGKKTLVASRLLECAASGEISAESLRAAGDRALKEK
jgi:hypothetical protein